MKTAKSMLAGSGVMLMALTGCGNPLEDSGVAEGDDITLRVGSGLTAQHTWWGDHMAPWMERVTELTDGQVEFETYAGGELVNEGEEAEALETGIIDVGTLLPIYQPAEFPLADVTMLPLPQSDSSIALDAWRTILESDVELDGQTYYEREYASRGIHSMPLGISTPYTISTTGLQFESPSDLDGAAIRTPSTAAEFFADATGLDSITMPGEDMYDSLSRGAIDGSMIGVDLWGGYGFQDLFRYTVTDFSFGHFNVLLGMTQDTWDSLPDDVQEAMVQANEEVYADAPDVAAELTQEMEEANTADGGEFVAFTDLPEDVQEVFLEGAEETWTRYIDTMDQRGEPGKETALLWRDAILDAGGEVPDAVAELD